MHTSIHTLPSSSTIAGAPDSLDLDIEAFNAAFDELDLGWRWDSTMFRALSPSGDDRERVAGYLLRYAPHLLKVYDAEFLVELIVSTKAHWGRSGQ